MSRRLEPQIAQAQPSQSQLAVASWRLVARADRRPFLLQSRLGNTRIDLRLPCYQAQENIKVDGGTK